MKGENLMGEYTYTNEDLIKMQSRPFNTKLQVTTAKFLEFCQKTEYNVSLSFSGGADSSVLLDMFAKFWSLHREQHGNKPLLVIYANTSNEFASMPKHVKFFCEYIENKYDIKIDLHIVRSKITFFDVVKTEGYPVASKKVARMIRDVKEFLDERGLKYEDDIEPYLDQGIETANYLRSINCPATIVLRLSGYTRDNNISKTWSIPKKWRFLINAPFPISEHCCDILKKQPIKLVQKEVKANPIYGTLAEDSQMRRDAYLKTGCNAFKDGHGKSTPMGFWTRQDILRYLHDFNIPIAPPYGEIVQLENGKFEFTKEHNTGCKLCLFGCHLEKEPNRIQRLVDIEPNTYKFVMKSREEGGLGYREVMDYLGIPYENKGDT